MLAIVNRDECVKLKHYQKEGLRLEMYETLSPLLALKFISYHVVLTCRGICFHSAQQLSGAIYYFYVTAVTSLVATD